MGTDLMDLPRRHPRIAHFMPYLRGDSLGAIRRAKRLRFRYIDQNMLCTSDGVPVVMHWPKYRKGGFSWYWTGSYVRTRTGKRRELRKRIDVASWPAVVEALPWSRVATLRTARRGGYRPRLARDHIREAARVGIVLMLECKGSPGFEQPKPWQALARTRDATGAHVGVMTLSKLPNPERALARLRQARAAGFPVAVLPRGKAPAAATLAGFRELGAKLWGRSWGAGW